MQIITPDATILNEPADEIRVPTVTGEITILPHHENLLTELVHGELAVKTKKGENYIAVTGGFCEVQNDQVAILSDYAVPSENISVEKALEARRQAEEVLKRSRESVSERDFALAEANLRRAILEIDVAGRRRRHRNT